MPGQEAKILCAMSMVKKKNTPQKSYFFFLVFFFFFCFFVRGERFKREGNKYTYS